MRESVDRLILDTCGDKLSQWAAVMGKASYRDEKHALLDEMSPADMAHEEKLALREMYERLKAGGA